MIKAANTRPCSQAQQTATGMFSFPKNSIQRHALPACLLFFLLGMILITIELLGVLSLAVILLSLVLTQMDGWIRSRMEG